MVIICYLSSSWYVGPWFSLVLSIKPCLHTEANQKFNSNLVIFPEVGAFEQLFGPGRGAFEQKVSKNSNARGIAQGRMLKLRFD